MSLSPAETIARLEADATRHETPCGDGVMVWRRWGKGRPLALLHGGSGSWKHWLRNIEPLARHYTLWVPDLPGFGESALPPEPVDFEPISAAVSAGLRQLLPGNAHFDMAGFSFGAHAALYVARDLAPRVDTLVVINGHIVGPLKVQPSHLLEHWRSVTDEAERLAIFRRNLETLMFWEPANIDEIAMHAYAIDLPRARVRPPKFLNDRDMTLISRLGGRIVNIAGEHDTLGRPSAAAQQEELRRARPNVETHLVSGAGHWVQYEAADRFHGLLHEVLQQRPSA